MADSPLNHSWPSFSKLWMKRWSFKRASECKPCIAPCGSPSASLSVPPQAPFGTGSSSSLSPPSIAEDAFFGSSKKDKDACSVVSDYDCPCAELSSSVEDLLDPSCSLKDSEYFKDLEGGIPASFTAPTERNPRPLGLQVSLNTDTKQPTHTSLSTHSHRVNAPSSPFYIHPAEEPHQNFVVTQLRPKLHPGCIIDSDESSGPAVGLSLTINLNGLPGSMETAKGITGSQEEKEGGVGLDGELDEDSFPILVRSMSTSRRHSLGVPMSHINLGRRLSLDTMATDKETDDCSLSVPCPRARVTSMACGVPRRHLYSRSEILATDECSRAAHISRVVQTSKQAARAAGAEEFDPEENLHSTDGQSHMLMVQKVLQELKLYHGAKQGNNRLDTKVTGSVTWYEFLSNENEEEEDRTEKVEKGTKVKRTLSSLRNRVTGSFNKDKLCHLLSVQQDPAEEAWPAVHEAENPEDQLQTTDSAALMNCAVNVHKSCKSLLGECSSSRIKRDSHPRIGSSGSPNPAGVLSDTPELSSGQSAARAGGQEDEGRENEEGKNQKAPPAKFATFTMEPEVSKVAAQTTVSSRIAKSLSSSSWGLSRHVGVPVWMHRDLITCRFRRPLPRSLQKEKYWHRDRELTGLDGHPGSLGTPGMTISPWGNSTHTHSSTAASNASLRHNNSSGSLPGEMDETDALRSKRCNEDAISLAPSTTESIIVEDAHYAAVRADLESDAQDLEAESWSSAVDQPFVKKHPKQMVKRQDVIYELMQTEMHHVRTLKIMLCVYVRELKENLQMDSGKLDCLFPRLENLLELHTHFLSRLKERRRENLTSPNERNYSINRVADILITQFSGEVGGRMKESYGDFCSHHTEAVSYYKEQLHNNKKFQNIIRKVNNLSIVRRLGVSECILLVTQRIMKYPVLVERIILNTEAGTEEHEELTRALGLIKDTIVQVDTLVNVHEKNSRLQDIHNKMEPKALGKIKDDRVFRREDLAQTRRRLLHEGTVNWKAASGRLKDILAVLLSDVLLLLQDKDQRYVFATVDNKPPVISLQKLIVREVAHEEKAMFLICASSNEPEMYEIHTASKEERNTWMAHIRQAVESCPHTEERLFSEEEEAQASRLKEFQERLSQKDSVVVQALTEKLQLFAEMSESVVGLEDTAARSRLLLRGDASDLQQGEALLKGAITEGKTTLHYMCRDTESGVREESPTSRLEEGSGSGVLPRRADTFGGYDSSPSILNKSEWNRIWSNSFPEAEFFDKVLMLSQRLYSLQAIIAQQDSHMELQRASLTERASLSGRHRGNVLLEQEKQRTLALQREELASFHKLQEEECRRLEELLAEERRELESQRGTYQQDLERLRESTRSVEKEKERLEHQKKIKRKTIEVAPLSGSLNGDLLMSSGLTTSSLSVLDQPIPQKPLVRGSLSVAPADYAERPEVMLRREASASALPLKTEVPLHLFSTTNQQHKLLGVQQQIPTKLAAFSSGKGKGGKIGKASHRTDSSASVDMKQMLPLKLSARDDNALKAKRSVSPNQQSAPPLPPTLHHHSDPLSPPDSGPDSSISPPHPPNVQKPPLPPSMQHSQSPSMHPHSQSTGCLQPPVLSPNAQVQVNVHGLSYSPSMPPPYKMAPEDLNKEDVIFF
ncbi:hypothetical protein JOQ06_005857 [Pogonophryne albipinna]|uniref:Rho guanine nucleotide exchange factor 18-like n=1 Tax=Pogonophryne albipinna TaxID=1090488 RepID=A0AAD6BIB6_9TELE|nr:hypothetical protein JOQ06_005857 [Pogonophryne albipinna]